MLTDLKVVELYQNLRIKSMAGFGIRYMLTNLKAVCGIVGRGRANRGDVKEAA